MPQTLPPVSARATAAQARRRRGREALAIVMTLVIAVVAVGGAFLIASGSLRSLATGLPFAQPTPVPTLAPLDALRQIQAAYPSATIRVSSSLADEVDLITDTSTGVNTSLTGPFTTKILSLFLRGYPKQAFWRWVDRNAATRTTTVFEAHTGEFWVITQDAFTCTPHWTIWAIAPDAIMKRGAAGGDYTAGTASQPAAGLPPGFSYPCRFSA